jgi:hypothetical protein
VAAEGAPVIVVPGYADDARAAPRHSVGDNPREVVVAGALTLIRQVAGQQEDVRPETGLLQQAEPPEQVVPGPDAGRE